MISFVIMNFLCFLRSESLYISSIAKREEYCFSEIFIPKCNDHQIIVIHEAIYGRKKFGRCLQDEDEPTDTNLKDPKFIGCYGDVKNLVMPKCFGKQQCDLRVAEISAGTSCHKYLKLYLEVSYSCLTVAAVNNKHCTVTLSNEKQYLHIQHRRSFECGFGGRPFVIEALPGQNILINAIAFIYNNFTSSENSYGNCDDFGNVVDKKSSSKHAICLRTSQKLHKICESESNRVEIQLNQNMIGTNQNILISLEATGCSDLIPPADAWLKRTENEATIGCYSTRLRWQLKCLGQRWIGVIGNCSYAHPHQYEKQSNPAREIKENNQSFKYVIVLTVLMFGIVICIFISCFGIVCFRRHRSLSRRNSPKSFHLVQKEMEK